jgi:hypothetical protein
LKTKLLKLLIAFAFVGCGNLFSQDTYPDKIYLSKGDTLICKVNFINTKIVYLTDGVLKKNGKRKPKDKKLELSLIKGFKLASSPEIADKNYPKLLNKFSKKFYDLKCEPLMLGYNKPKDEVISETRENLSRDLESATYLGVSVINGEKFLNLTKVIYFNTGAYYDIPKDSKVSFHLQGGGIMEFKIDTNFKLVHHTKQVAFSNYYYQSEVKEYRTGSVLKVTLPITDEKLLELSKLKVNLITIVDIDKEIREFKVTPERIEYSTKVCLCGFHMN